MDFKLEDDSMLNLDVRILLNEKKLFLKLPYNDVLVFNKKMLVEVFQKWSLKQKQ